MNSSDEVIEVSSLRIFLRKKEVKSIRIAVLPPSGLVRVTAPLSYDRELIESVVIRKLNWIRRQQDFLKNQERQTAREAVSGESYFYKGKKYRLKVKEGGIRGKLIIKDSSLMELSISKDASQQSRLNVINTFYRKRLQEDLDLLVPNLSKEIGVEVTQYGIRKMKNRWGSCDSKNKRITINLDLIKKNPACLNYIVVHELIHLIEPTHSKNFKDLMNRYLPNWRYLRDLLNDAPLAHTDWRY
jgi:predicted metal-dependent hydrolase